MSCISAPHSVTWIAHASVQQLVRDHHQDLSEPQSPVVEIGQPHQSVWKTPFVTTIKNLVDYGDYRVSYRISSESIDVMKASELARLIISFNQES